MKTSVAEFAPGARFQKGADTSNPALVAAHIESIRSSNDGELTPNHVVADASNSNSPLHSFFEWDDTEAAHQHRLHQARNLIRTIVVRYEEVSPPQPIRVYVNVKSPLEDVEDGKPRQHYTSLAEALSEPDTRRAVLLRAKNELDAWRSRYAGLKDFADIVSQASLMSEKISELTDA